MEKDSGPLPIPSSPACGQEAEPWDRPPPRAPSPHHILLQPSLTNQRGSHPPHPHPAQGALQRVRHRLQMRLSPLRPSPQPRGCRPAASQMPSRDQQQMKDRRGALF